MGDIIKVIWRVITTLDGGYMYKYVWIENVKGSCLGFKSQLCPMTHVADPSMHAQTLARLSYILGAVLSSIQQFTMNKALSKSNASRYTCQLSGVNLDVFDLPYQHVRRHR